MEKTIDAKSYQAHDILPQGSVRRIATNIPAQVTMPIRERVSKSPNKPVYGSYADPGMQNPNPNSLALRALQKDEPNLASKFSTATPAP